MQGIGLDALIGLRLSIVRRAANMLVLHFGEVRAHASGVGTVGAYALHIQCAWRFDGPTGTITGRDDLWEYGGDGERPPNWSPEDGLSMQDLRFGIFFSRDVKTRSWVNDIDRFFVARIEQTKRGDIKIELSEGYEILAFPDSYRLEAWRFFAPGSSADHLIFPNTTLG
jgi:hypothetical protein